MQRGRVIQQYGRRMSTVICPNCGGTLNRLLAPGYYECASTIVENVVPRGWHGNAQDIPITRICGHRFQVGGAPQLAQCSCGMFAVGSCRQCGEARCGTHASLDDAGVFLCNSHLQERAQRRAAKEARAKAERNRRGAEIALEAEQQRQQMLRARQQALPELPAEGGAMAPQLSAALRKLVPDRVQTFVVDRKSLGRSTTVRGWGFALSVSSPENSQRPYYRHRGLIVTDDDRAFVVRAESASKEWIPGEYAHWSPPALTTTVGAADVQIIVSHVLKWTGRTQAAGTTPARMAHLERLVTSGKLSRAEADRLAPNGAISNAAWAKIRAL